MPQHNLNDLNDLFNSNDTLQVLPVEVERIPQKGRTKVENTRLKTDLTFCETEKLRVAKDNLKLRKENMKLDHENFLLISEFKALIQNIVIDSPIEKDLWVDIPCL